MIRSLSTGVSGLLTNQKRMDLIGNNIANSSTTGFKKSRATFAELMAQEVSTQSSNPNHVGLGVEIASIDQNFDQGSLETTGKRTDLALTGDGFFLVKEGQRNYLTRAGAFSFNDQGQLTAPAGEEVQGWAFDKSGKLQTGETQTVQINFNAKTPANPTSTATIEGNIDSQMAEGDKTSVSTTIYDEQGNPHSIVVDYKKTGTDTFSYEVRYPGTGAAPYDTSSASGTIAFNTDGSVKEITDSNGDIIKADRDGDGTPENILEVTLPWEGTSVTGGPDITIDMANLVQRAGSTTSKFTSQDGYEAGSIAGYNIDQEGVVNVQYTNGESEKVYQLALANVNNPNGLANEGKNLYGVTTAAGDLQLARAGRDLPTTVRSGTLEQSNVDLAEEFSNMIVTQRAYQANARVITKSDQMLQELNQMVR